MESHTLDRLDWCLLEALGRAPRIPFSRLADILGVSDQTVSRRYQQLCQQAGLRVRCHLQPSRPGEIDWFLRLQCSPDTAASVASALAARDDTSWVQLASGGTEVTCVVRARTGAGGPVLLERLVGGRRLVGITAHALLHRFSPMLPPLMTGHLGRAQLDLLDREALGHRAGLPPEPLALDDIDEAVLSVLALDGRATVVELAQAVNANESTVRRRLDQLQRSGQLVCELDIDNQAGGLPVHALLWISVIPTELNRVGEALAADVHVTFAAATTGPTNLMASVLASDPGDLYRFLTEHIGSQREMLRLETAPIMRTVKRHGQLRAAVG